MVSSLYMKKTLFMLFQKRVLWEAREIALDTVKLHRFTLKIKIAQHYVFICTQLMAQTN